MPLNFNDLYVLKPSDNFLDGAPAIVFGVRKNPNAKAVEGQTVTEWQFLVNNDISIGHSIIGEAKDTDDDGVEIQDPLQLGKDGAPIVWRFEPLTLERWRALGKKYGMIGFDKLNEEFKTDDDLLHFYRSEWLDDAFSWWKEHPEGDGAPVEPMTPDEPVPSGDAASEAPPAENVKSET